MQIQVIGNLVMAIISGVLIINSAKKAEKIKHLGNKIHNKYGFYYNDSEHCKSSICYFG